MQSKAAGPARELDRHLQPETCRQKNRRRRNRKKRSKQKRAQERKEQAAEQQQRKEAVGEKEVEKEKTSEVEIEYVTEEPEIYDPNFIFFKRIFEAFKVTQRTTRENMFCLVC